MMFSQAKITVIMGIYNCATTLQEAIASLEKQTFTDWNIVMCDDGSTDETLQIAMEMQKKNPCKYLVLQNKENMGLNYTLNRCIEHANGEYVARMDGDDICVPERFEKEVVFLDQHPEYAFVSSPMILYDEKGEWGCDWGKEYPKNIDIMRDRPFCHAACMIRRDALINVGGYSVDKKLLRVEDLHLWLKLYANEYYGYNIQEPLYKMRDDRNAYARRKFKYRINEAYVKYLTVKMLGFPFYYLIYALRPIFVGLLPDFIYDYLHKTSLKSHENEEKKW